MAIEFDCPFCKATIRVPDAYGGRQGRCPGCNTRLLIPVVMRPEENMPSAGQPAPEMGTAVPAQIPGTAAVPLPPTTETASQNPPSVSDPSSLMFAETKKPVARTTRRTGSRRPSRALVIGMPVIGFLILMAIIGYVITSQLPSLTGEMNTVRITDEQVGRSVIAWSETGLDESGQATLRAALQSEPETLTSEIMTCRLIGTEKGISVQLTSSSSTEWYAVDPNTEDNKTLGIWLRKARNDLNVARVAELKTGLQRYCADKLKQLSGERIQLDAVSIRDDVALNASSGPLSYASQAVVGKRAIRFAAEDDKGRLLICLPKGTLAFEIMGRTAKDGPSLFAGNYQVIVTPGVTVEAPATSAGPNDESEKSTETPADEEPGEMSTDDSAMSKEPDSDSDEPPKKSKEMQQ